MFVPADATVADDDIRFTRGDRRDQRLDVVAMILAVGIGVDDDVSTRRERRVEARLKGGGEAPVAAVADDVVDAVLAGDLARSVGAAVVDD